MTNPLSAQEFWELINRENFAIPAMWDYQIWDEVVYELMVLDRIRLDSYQHVIARHAQGLTVVEIGAGASMPLSMRCVEAGALRVYAIETDPVAAESARQLVAERGLGDTVFVIESDSTDAQLPELVDICVSEIVGGIGSSEGGVAAIGDAARFMKPNGRMIPSRCDTLFVPMQKPDVMYRDAGIEGFEAHYRERVAQAFGRELEFTRYEFYNLPADHYLAEPAEFERVVCEPSGTSWTFGAPWFEITRDGRFDGVMCWLNLYVDADTMIETLRGTSWAPIYMPHSPIEVRRGDVMRLAVNGWVGADGAHPDYSVTGTVQRAGDIVATIAIESPWLKE